MTAEKHTTKFLESEARQMTVEIVNLKRTQRNQTISGKSDERLLIADRAQQHQMIASPSAWAEVTSHNPSRQGYAGGIRELRWGIGERTREKSHNQLKKRMRSVGDALLASHALRSYGKQEKRSAIGKIANTDQWIVAASVGAKVTVVEIKFR